MQSRARILAGGTGIYELAGRGLLSEVEALVDVSGLGWAYVRKGPKSVKIGAATTMTQLAHSKELESPALGAVADALRAIQPIQVKNVATVAGAICTGLPFFDLPTALLAVGAVVHVGPRRREVELNEFIKGIFTIDLSPGEFVRELEIPEEEGRSSAFQKFALTSDDWAMINCGVSLRLDDGKIRDPKLVFGGGVGGRPVRATRTEKAIQGAREPQVRAIIEKELPLELETISDIRSSSEYRLQLAKVLGRRTVTEACARAGRGKRQR